jgi:hypothetical protein
LLHEILSREAGIRGVAAGLFRMVAMTTVRDRLRNGAFGSRATATGNGHCGNESSGQCST